MADLKPCPFCEGAGVVAELKSNLKVLESSQTFATDNNVGDKWISVSDPPKKYRDENGYLIPFLVCYEGGTEYPFRAMYDGKAWGDGFYELPVTHWMHLPEPPKGE